MDVKEHFFSYNPYDGHPDKITNAPGYQYFFLGNGHIQAAIQYNKFPNGSPLGLILNDPDIFGKKSDSFTYDEKFGLEKTIVELKVNGKMSHPTYDNLKVYWDNNKHLPTVVAHWHSNQISVKEEFFCPSIELPSIIRNVIVKNEADKKVQGEFFINFNISEKLSFKKRKFQFTIQPDNEKVFSFVYSIDKNIPGNVFIEFLEKPISTYEIDKYWANIDKINLDNEKLNHILNCSIKQITATTSSIGKLDSSIWQYNLEWVRDLSNIAVGCLMSGHFETAKNILTRLITYFVDEDGSTIDSSNKRPLAEVELDQNGILLWALWNYWVWTDDFEIIKSNWEKIILLANFPLKEIFWDKESKLLKNCREYWERHAVFGVTTGYELTYQLFPIIGLAKASEMAEHLGDMELANKWMKASEEIKKSFLSDPKFALIDKGHFIKRRKESGEVHLIFEPPDKSLLADNVPLKEENINLAEPDTSEALPIAFELMNPQSALSFETLEYLEKLWNQRWDFGGYSRYNVKSEPDSPGPWPFASMFIARAYHENGNREKVQRIIDWMFNQSRESGSWFEFYGWRPTPPCPPVSIIPWTWAEIVIFSVHHLIGIRPQQDKIIIRPKLLDLVNKIESKIRIKNNIVKISVLKNKDLDSSYAIVNGSEKISLTGNFLELPYPKNIDSIQIFIK